MDWFLIFVSVAIIWLASICKILHASFYPYQSSFANNAAGSLQKKNVLLVIAHPDDESMFFSPTINQLTSRGHNMHILCMSTGNADGIGDVRKEELYRASAILKVPLQQVTVLDHPDFQDGFGKVWNSTVLSNIVEKKVLDHAIDLIITFDNYGVSGHCNHRDVHRGVQRFMLDTSHREIEAWELVSTNIVRKYSGPIDIWLSFWTAHRSLNGQMHCLLNEHPLRSYVAMSQHLTQWVWFRKLFVSFSSYTYVNTLRKTNK
ncbi:probable N-acetylglucosaminyl-phosphatidylinositol de-N-acetylase isoform X1 [Cynara cardunculus var. scolymus]|uniref:probable N-acetylglucosaminyl-phosphatidylinositol de-N-acetylase isoform X1 n=2 Tax=Cynara cardunculus var. scolymus TaxID=59895 RepID=UPI000D62ACBE|nr:probable N-acetylglucosaminyl-phosphatidylinositol de-N-acetylase isoform X1 [Cynara cardunculus var. scolymus]XP_024992379.1 probable N-acetylglucosaminyl-phosphatidylinositol de-N-acetylase isoform X1 [Cynara cardunculus var. scolymus]